MQKILSRSCAIILLSFCALTTFAADAAKPEAEPKKIDPGSPPSDAIVLFDGKDLSQWITEDNKPATWPIDGGILTVGGGDIYTKEKFADCQLHIEWASPEKVEGEGQGRGNSGIFFQSRYEVQVLDSFTNKTYFNGQAGAVYKQHAPLVNVTRPPGEWQVYDIVFHAPRFEDGKLQTPGRVTVLHNGVLIQDNVTIQGTTRHDVIPMYWRHEAKESLKLQDHHCPVRYRNIWIRPL
jgi:hypothetical protein